MHSHLQDSDSLVLSRSAGDDHLSGIADSIFLGSVVLGGKAGTLLDPIASVVHIRDEYIYIYI